MATENFYITPSDGWVQIADAPDFIRTSGFPHTHPYYIFSGSSAPSLAGTVATGTVTFSGGVPSNGQNVKVGNETYLFKTTAVDPSDVQIVPATPGVGTVTFAGGVPTAAQTLLIGSETYTFVAAAVLPFDVTIGGTPAATATNLITAITANSTLVTAATGGSGIVTVTSILNTVAGNYAYSTAATHVSVTGTTLTGGQDGSLLTAVNFTSIVNAVSAIVTASDTGGVVTLTSKLVGNLGNYALTKTGTHVAVSGAVLTGGADAELGVLVCHKPFWVNVTSSDKYFARNPNPVAYSNGNTPPGALRLDVVTVS